MPRAVRRFAYQSQEQRATSHRLRRIPNIGPAMANGLRRFGIADPADLVGRDADDLYDALHRLDGRRHHPCVRNVFAAAFAFANGEPARPGWAFTPEHARRET
ncbi:MAG: helix-hairpin-helix domain-containing protein [Chloroflexota bacterium]|nr:helix-hairpin-helix domain-containing protein [Chloroflexota bacterium]